MIISERQFQIIVSLYKSANGLDYDELARMLNTSSRTIRRELDQLYNNSEFRGQIIKGKSTFMISHSGFKQLLSLRQGILNIEYLIIICDLFYNKSKSINEISQSLFISKVLVSDLLCEATNSKEVVENVSEEDIRTIFEGILYKYLIEYDFISHQNTISTDVKKHLNNLLDLDKHNQTVSLIGSDLLNCNLEKFQFEKIILIILVQKRRISLKKYVVCASDKPVIDFLLKLEIENVDELSWLDIKIEKFFSNDYFSYIEFQAILLAKQIIAEFDVEFNSSFKTDFQFQNYLSSHIARTISLGVNERSVSLELMHKFIQENNYMYYVLKKITNKIDFDFSESDIFLLLIIFLNQTELQIITSSFHLNIITQEANSIRTFNEAILQKEFVNAIISYVDSDYEGDNEIVLNTTKKFIENTFEVSQIISAIDIVKIKTALKANYYAAVKKTGPTYLISPDIKISYFNFECDIVDSLVRILFEKFLDGNKIFDEVVSKMNNGVAIEDSSLGLLHSRNKNILVPEIVIFNCHKSFQRLFLQTSDQYVNIGQVDTYILMLSPDVTSQSVKNSFSHISEMIITDPSYVEVLKEEINVRD